MNFIPISIDSYVKLHLKNNPGEKKEDLKKRLNTALSAYQNGIKCSCGSDIWVIGSAFAGNSCFTCITGESLPSDDYEIKGALEKRLGGNGRRHIDSIDPEKIAGFFDDDGYEINMDLIAKPGLCLTCIHDENPDQAFFCQMVRYDHDPELVFQCGAFKNKM